MLTPDISPLTPQQAAELLPRYFDAQTSEEEEAALRRFAASPQAGAPEFDELRAVMSLSAYARRRTVRRPARRMPVMRYAAAVLLFLMAGGGYLFHRYNTENVCIAYVNGVKETDTDVVMAQMRRSLRDMGQPVGEQVMEAQLEDVFADGAGEE